jgi:hypothetical protein
MKPFVILMLVGAAFASTSLGQGFPGSYTGEIGGVPMKLVIQQRGEALQGEADASGYRYTLSGHAEGTTARGTLADPQTGGGVEVEMMLQGDQFTLTLLAADPYTGQVQRTPLQFQRNGAAAGQGQSASAGSNPGVGGHAGAGSQGAVERAPRLVGNWSFTETMMSGEFSSVSQVFLQVNPDGSYAYGNGRTMAGGSSAYGSISGDTGYGGDVSRGQWRTQGQIVYIQEAGSPQWVPYAKYYVEGGRMMFTYNDGSRQVWHRR